MKKRDKKSKVVPINWIDDIDRWIVVPGTRLEGRRRRIKEVPLLKNKCFFAGDMPRGIIDFIYRAVVRLGLGDRTLFFSRGTVRSSKALIKYNVGIRELDWGVGLLVTIPRLLKCREEKTVRIEDRDYSLNVMETVVLHGLLRIAYPEKNASFHFAMAALILARGWGKLTAEHPPRVSVITE